MSMHTNNLTDEAGRLEALEHLEAEAHGSEASFDLITKLVQLTLKMDTATINLITRDKQKPKAVQGLGLSACPREIAFCNITIQGYEPLIIEDTKLDQRVQDNPLVTGPPFLRSYIGAPLTTADGYNLGALCAVDSKPRRFTTTEIDVLSKCAELVMNQLELRAQANRDFLTGLHNRRSFMFGLNREMAQLRRNRRVAAIALLDIDHFKHVNDTFGHPAGDRVLREFAGILEEECRQSDLIARIGGEEFAVLLPESDLCSARRWADRVRKKIAAARFDGERALRLTASIGITAVDGAIGEPDAIMASVDHALYEAKQLGRNRIVEH